MSDKILVGIHRAIHDKVDYELGLYKSILIYNNISFIDLDSSLPDFWTKVKGVTHFIYKWSHNHSDGQIARSVIPIVQEKLGKRCFPNWETSWHYDDKIRQAYLLEILGYPVCKTYVFYHKNIALEWLNMEALFPLVWKLTHGSGSANVKLIKDKKRAKKIVNRMFGKGIKQDGFGIWYTIKTMNFNLVKIYRYYGIRFRNWLFTPNRKPFWQLHKNYVLFQDYMPGNTYDTRVQITGDRAFAFVRYNRPNDFRASGSNNWSLDHDKIDMEFVKIAFEISKKLNFQSMAYDFIYDPEGNPKIVEISYCYGDYPEFSTGYWDPNLNWHSGFYIPHYLELIDLLELPDLKLPPDVKAGSTYTKATIN